MSGPAEEIMFVLHDLPLGGTERIALRLATRWLDAGRRVRLLCGLAEGPMRPMLDPRIELVTLDPPLPRGFGSRFRLGAAAAREVRRRPPSVLFVPGNFHWVVAGAVGRLPAAMRPPIVARLTSPVHRPGRGRLPQLWFERRMRRQLRRVDALATLSESYRRDADRVLGRAASLTLKLPALDAAVPPPLPVPEGVPLILAAGRLVPQKGFDDAIAAFRRLSHPAAKLVILGDGPDRAALEARVAALGLGDRVSMPGTVPDIRPWLDRARLFLLSSRFEGFPAVLVESLAAGRPVVATRCTPATAELLDGTARGLSVPIGDAAAMAGAMDALLGAPPPDPAALAASVADHRIERIAEQYLALFDRLVAARRTTAGSGDGSPASEAGR
ncbi:glycosyltransferase [Rhizosaccharibacter radicis]|uniref:Glycosyltransferase n=1 Tax=Rhizosaccharibacter radicis TaxID=2782605 RepID=A0ABT1W123_9PROT|nr:glycosyltransferase [Acetobacteraceae bacterium KSS12]